MAALSVAAYRPSLPDSLIEWCVVATTRGPVFLDGATGLVRELSCPAPDRLPRAWTLPGGTDPRRMTHAAKDARKGLNLVAGTSQELLRYAFDDSLHLLAARRVPFVPGNLAVVGDHWFVNAPFEEEVMFLVDNVNGESKAFQRVRRPDPSLLRYKRSWHLFRRRRWISAWAGAAVDADHERVYVGFLIQPFCIAIHDHCGGTLDVVGPDRVRGTMERLDVDMRYGRVGILDVAARPFSRAVYLLIADAPEPRMGILSEDGLVDTRSLPEEARDAFMLVWLSEEVLALCTRANILIYRDVP